MPTSEARRAGRRDRTTRRSVRWAERVARICISIGGIGTILAVSLIFVFLFAVVVPLFGSTSVAAPVVVAEAGGSGATARPALLHAVVDEYRMLEARLYADGRYEVRRLDDGSPVESGSLLPDREGLALVAFAASPTGADVVLGLSDGHFLPLRFGFRFDHPKEGLPPIEPDQVLTWQQGAQKGVLTINPEGIALFQGFAPVLEPEQDPDLGGVAPHLIAFAGESDARAVLVLTEDGRLALVRTEKKLDWMTGEERLVASAHPLPYGGSDRSEPPSHLLLLAHGGNALLAWDDGWAQRLDLHDVDAPRVVEELDLVPEEGARISALGVLLGDTTVLVGDDTGRLQAWFGSKPAGAGTPDGVVFKPVHELQRPGADAPMVTRLASSARSRLLFAGRADGSLCLFQVTLEKRLVSVQLGDADSLEAIAVAPKEDALYAFTRAGTTAWALDTSYPSAGLKAYFAPIWYEDYAGPSHVWQAESAAEDFEPKYGFVPLVFGTLKATFYTMLFGAPLAILAAIFTSEFLPRRLRTPVKSSIEMMASLPSVVLGFLAALVIAPFSQRILPATLALFVTLPVSLLCGAYLWQLLPQPTTIRLSGIPRLLLMALFVLGLGFPAAFVVGPFAERIFFAGDMEAWLDGQRGSALGGWLFLTLPLTALVVAFAGGRLTTTWIRARSHDWSRAQAALVDVARFALGLLAVLGIALGAAWLLTLMGLDARGTFFDTYVQRNALVVGLVMGFAVIPIIYTLAEDALSSVPEHLRLASLGAGATTWQTAIRVIVPTATSGIFSALMIGLGRAVGETMIVLMATGNTPVLQMNLFNGFRTLSANIAVELPEAVQGSAHYRALFLAALILFGITFLLNTAAEAVRQRFRKRAVQL